MPKRLLPILLAFVTAISAACRKPDHNATDRHSPIVTPNIPADASSAANAQMEKMWTRRGNDWYIDYQGIRQLNEARAEIESIELSPADKLNGIGRRYRVRFIASAWRSLDSSSWSEWQDVPYLLFPSGEIEFRGSEPKFVGLQTFGDPLTDQEMSRLPKK